MKVLIIEDEKELATSISDYLKTENYLCEFAETFSSAMEKIQSYEYDCILLDLTLPGGHGLKILEKLNEQNRQDGVIIISAKDSVDDRIRGLQLGADDYLSKPFHLSELGARIYSVVRRKQFRNSNAISFDELQVDFLAKAVKVNEKPVPLTKKEFELLQFLIGNQNRVISKNAMAEHLSGDMADMLDNSYFVYAHIKNLKKKLADAGCQDYIKTIYGVGYKFQP
ncbi:MAG: response regulator transcription factor [Daejeonella sp.]